MTSPGSSIVELPKVGVVILDYLAPKMTVECIQALLEREPSTSRILWVENGGEAHASTVHAALAAAPFRWQELQPEANSLPEAGIVGVIWAPSNLGYGAGNNLGLRLLRKAGLPYAWVLNNDTRVIEGCSTDLVRRAEGNPGIGAWGTTLLEGDTKSVGCRVLRSDFSAEPITKPDALTSDADACLSGCSLFLNLKTIKDELPEDYFLYYEDLAFSMELRRKRIPLGCAPEVVVEHFGSSTTGRRSALTEYYTRRNRWWFIQRYHPSALAGQKRKLLYRLQKYLVRGRWTQLRAEWRAFSDFKKGRTGPINGR